MVLSRTVHTELHCLAFMAQQVLSLALVMVLSRAVHAVF